jgi:hypothetical protein
VTVVDNGDTDDSGNSGAHPLLHANRVQIARQLQVDFRFSLEGPHNRFLILIPCTFNSKETPITAKSFVQEIRTLRSIAAEFAQFHF